MTSNVRKFLLDDPIELNFHLNIEDLKDVEKLNLVLLIPSIIEKRIDLKKKSLFVKTILPPLLLCGLLNDSKIEAVIMGIGPPRSTAVVILESLDENGCFTFKGMCRLITLSATKLLAEIVLISPKSQLYNFTVNSSSDISKGISSIGSVMHNLGSFGLDTTNINISFISNKKNFIEKESKKSYHNFFVFHLPINTLIGRSIAVCGEENDSMFGVVALSSGIWENNKLYCPCSGTDTWSERRQFLSNFHR